VSAKEKSRKKEKRGEKGGKKDIFAKGRKGGRASLSLFSLSRCREWGGKKREEKGSPGGGVGEPLINNLRTSVSPSNITRKGREKEEKGSYADSTAGLCFHEAWEKQK